MDQGSIERLRRMANGYAPTLRGNTRTLRVHEFVTHAREVCDALRIDYSDRATHGDAVKHRSNYKRKPDAEA
jgi:hypothetical protein